MSNSFVFATWNAGSRTADYLQHLDIPPLNLQNELSLLNSMNRLRDKFLTELTRDLTETVDVFALQEVSGDQRPDIQVLLQTGFLIVRPPKKNPLYISETDTAIAIHPKKFKAITNKSFNDPVSGRDFAVAHAVEKATGKKIGFISGHIVGFNLEETNFAAMKKEAKEGDDDMKQLLAKIDRDFSDCESIILGLDMNAFPEIYPDRFNLLRKAGFEIYRTNRPTNRFSRNFSGEIAKLQERELDYIFVKQNPSERSVHSMQLDLSHGITLDPISTPSDHIPVFLKIQEVQFLRKPV